METIEPLLLSIPDAARVTGMSRSALYREMTRGTIEARKLNGRTVLPYSSLRAFAAGLPRARFRMPAGGKLNAGE